jgi:malonate-semialdehyde dehydrogenase (acetylating)/methylmalonate-semialdehyde dehydrogenase
MAFFSFGGWKQSLFGDLHVYGPEGIAFYTRTKAITTRWPATNATSAGFHMPTAG